VADRCSLRIAKMHDDGPGDGAYVIANVSHSLRAKGWRGSIEEGFCRVGAGRCPDLIRSKGMRLESRR
jgi:hypothetical protein